MAFILSTSITPLSLLPLIRVFLILFSVSLFTGAYSKMPLFAEYIGAEYNGVTFSDVPINPNVNFHFILSFAIDYTVNGDTANPTDGHFNIFWQSEKLTPSSVASIKKSHNNVKVALSLGGDTVSSKPAVFSASAVATWVNNAVASLTKIIKDYHLDGIDIDYEHFKSDKSDKTTFIECIGQLVTKLKNNNVIKFASIAPFSDSTIEDYYTALFRKYGDLINYVNFQFYAYDKGTTVQQFLRYYDEQSSKYNGAKLLVSFSTETDSGGLSPGRGFFTACKNLKKQGKLNGIFVYSADSSFGKKDFKQEKNAQMLLAGGN